MLSEPLCCTRGWPVHALAHAWNGHVGDSKEQFAIFELKCVGLEARPSSLTRIFHKASPCIRGHVLIVTQLLLGWAQLSFN